MYWFIFLVRVIRWYFFCFQTLDLYSTIKNNEEILLDEESKENLLTLSSNEKLSLLIDDLSEENLDIFRQNLENSFHQRSCSFNINQETNEYLSIDIPLIIFLIHGEDHLITSSLFVQMKF